MDIIFFQHINQFGESRGYPVPFFVFYTLITLQQNFFYDESQIFFFFFVAGFIQIHKYCYKGGLPVCCHQSNNLILNCLNTPGNFFPNSFFNYVIELVRGIFYT